LLQSSDENINTRLARDRVACSLDKSELRAFLSILQERSDTAAELEIANFPKNDQTDDEYENNKNEIRLGYKLRPTLTGEDGRELNGTIDEIFDSPNFPESVRSIYLNSSIPLDVIHKFRVRNTVELFLDFSRPAIFDFHLMPSQRTPNESNYRVEGRDTTWVNGLFHEIQNYIASHRSPAPWLHQHSIYDFFLWLIGYPLAFWLCFKVSPLLPNGEKEILFVRAALYVYIFLIALVGLRALFHYARWVFPISEYRHARNRALRHRAFLGALSIGLFGTLLYDVIKSIAVA
jgi:hypothetical protein